MAPDDEDGAASVLDATGGPAAADSELVSGRSQLVIEPTKIEAIMTLDRNPSGSESIKTENMEGMKV